MASQRPRQWPQVPEFVLCQIVRLIVDGLNLSSNSRHMLCLMDPIRQTRRQRPVPQPEDLELWALIQGGFSCLATRSKLSLRTYSIQTVFSQFDMPIEETFSEKSIYSYVHNKLIICPFMT